MSIVERTIHHGRERVEEAVAAGVIARAGETLRFTHPLFATGVLEVSSLSEKRSIHRRLADLVAEPEERARHLAGGTEGPDEATAAAVEVAAASVASRGAPDAAARLGKLAVELTPPDLRSALHTRSLDYGRYTVAAGDPRKAAKILEQQRRAADAGSERAEVGLQLALAVRAAHGATAAIGHCEDALREVDGGAELELQARILTELADMHLVEMRTDSDVSQRAVALAEKVSDASLLARALGIHGLTLADRGLTPPTEYWERALDIERTAGPLRAHGPAHSYALVLLMRDDLGTAAARLLEVVDSMRRNEDIALPNVLLHLSDVTRTMGLWEDAVAYAEEAHEVTRLTGRDSLEPGCLLRQARIALLRGEHRRARSQVASALAVLDELRSREENAAIREGPVPEEGMAENLLARIALMSERYGEAHERFARQIETLRKLEMPEILVEVLTEDVTALIGLRAFEEAAAEVTEIETTLPGLGKPWLDALAARSRGLLAAAEGDLSSALGHLERSRDLLERGASPWPFEQGRTLLSLGSVQRRARQRQEARASLEHALTIFERLGAQVWAGNARAELARIGGRPARTGALTETERRVAETVATGRSNAEAAHALFMSPKTVEWNLSKIYKKLHVRSRSELAAKLVKQPPSPPP
jgi:DNA-binding CsgD family transcriptional regulator